MYREKMYFQPLPLFKLSNLREELATFPNYLRWAFFALALRHSNHPFYSGMKYEAIGFYTAGSRNIAMDLSMKGVTEISLLQSICLLALCEIIGETALICLAKLQTHSSYLSWRARSSLDDHRNCFEIGDIATLIYTHPLG